MTQEIPLSPAGDGRNPDGTFAAGNRAGRGNPMARKVQQLRSVMLTAVSGADLRAIIKKLVALAKEGDVAAAREVLQRCLGPVESPLVTIQAGPARLDDYDVAVIQQQIIEDNRQLAQWRADEAAKSEQRPAIGDE